MSQQCVTGCGRPTRDVRLLCDQCVWEVEQALAEMPALLDELSITLTGLARIGQKGGNSKKGTKGKTQPLGYDVRASEMLDDLRVFLSGWVRVIAEDHGHDLPTDTLRAMGRWLFARLDLIATHEAAEDIHREITGIAFPPYLGDGRARPGQAWHPVDRPADRVYAGKCEATVTSDEEPGDGLARGGAGHWRCEADLYARPNSATARCHDCGTEHSLDQRRERLLQELDDKLYTAGEIARLAVYLGEANRGRERTRKLINQWHKRGRLERHTSNEVGEPLFRFGTVLVELAKEEARREQVATKKAS